MEKALKIGAILSVICFAIWIFTLSTKTSKQHEYEIAKQKLELNQLSLNKLSTDPFITPDKKDREALKKENEYYKAIIEKENEYLRTKISKLQKELYK